jgi:RNA polymerase sigma factor (sigma-70 family)
MEQTQETLEFWVKRAKEGDKAALETVIRGIQDRVYGLALRMLWHTADAEDASQEILIKVLTHLSDFRHESSFLTWVYHIGCNHLLTRRKQYAEAKLHTFEQLNEQLQEGLLTPLFQTEIEQGEDWLFIEEVKIGCTLGMLLCLEREERIAFILGDIFEVSGEEGSAILSLPITTFRKRLSRARMRLRTFMESSCGLVNPSAPCRCTRQAAFKSAKVKANPKRLLFAAPLVVQGKNPEIVAGMQELTELDRVAALFRSHPDYQAPHSFIEAMQQLLRSGSFSLLDPEAPS